MNKICISVIAIIISFSAFAQKSDFSKESSSNWTDRIYTGGGFGLSGSSNSTMVSFSPLLGYMITNKLSGGLGVNYQYFRYKDQYFQYDDHRYGGNVFLRMNLFRNIFAYGSYQVITYNNRAAFIGETDRKVAKRLPLGFGLVQPMGKIASLNIIAAYDLLYTTESVYNSPWVFSVFVSM